MFKLVIIIMALVGQNPQPIPAAQLDADRTFQSKVECEQVAQAWLAKNGADVAKTVIEKTQGAAKPVGVVVQCTSEGEGI